MGGLVPPQPVTHQPNSAKACFLPQLDGNISLLSLNSDPYCQCCEAQSDSESSQDCDQDYPDVVQTIPVVCGSGLYKSMRSNPPPWYEEQIPTSAANKKQNRGILVSSVQSQKMGTF